MLCQVSKDNLNKYKMITINLWLHTDKVKIFETFVAFAECDNEQQIYWCKYLFVFITILNQNEINCEQKIITGFICEDDGHW